MTSHCGSIIENANGVPGCMYRSASPAQRGDCLIVLSDEFSVGDLITVIVVSWYNTRITQEAVKMCRFPDPISKKFWMNRLGKSLEIYILTSINCLRFTDLKKSLRLFPVLEFYYSEYRVHFLVLWFQAVSLSFLLILTIVSPKFWSSDALPPGEEAPIN